MNIETRLVTIAEASDMVSPVTCYLSSSLHIFVGNKSFPFCTSPRDGTSAIWFVTQKRTLPFQSGGVIAGVPSKWYTNDQ